MSQIKCKRYQTRDECMKAIDENCEYRPNIMALDAGEVFVGGRYHRLVLPGKVVQNMLPSTITYTY